MSAIEIKYVENILDNLRGYEEVSSLRVLPHCFMAMNDHRESISFDEIVLTILKGKFFEVNDNRNSFRIILRHPTTKTFDTIVVLDVLEHSIVTTYKNHHQDHHNTIKMGEYDSGWDIKLIAV